MDSVERRHAVTLVEVFSLWRRTAVEAAEQAGGGCRHVRAAEVVYHVCPCEALVVAALQRADGLELVGEHHARYAEQGLQFVVPVLHITSSRLLLSERLQLRLL